MTSVSVLFFLRGAAAAATAGEGRFGGAGADACGGDGRLAGTVGAGDALAFAGLPNDSCICLSLGVPLALLPDVSDATAESTRTMPAEVGAGCSEGARVSAGEDALTEAGLTAALCCVGAGLAW